MPLKKKKARRFDESLSLGLSPFALVLLPGAPENSLLLVLSAVSTEDAFNSRISQKVRSCANSLKKVSQRILYRLEGKAIDLVWRID